MDGIFKKLGITYPKVGSLFLSLTEIIFGVWFVARGLPELLRGDITKNYQTEITVIIGVYLLILGVKTFVGFLQNSRKADISHVMVWSFLAIISTFWGFNPAYLSIALFSYLWYVLVAEAE